MHVPWMVLAMCVAAASSRSTQRRDAASPQIGDLLYAHPRTPLSALLDSSVDDAPTSLHPKLEHATRTRRASPSTDEVTDGPASPWLRKTLQPTLPKTNFITAREHRTEKLKPAAAASAEEQRNLSVHTNEIPTPPQRTRVETGAVQRGRDVAVIEPRQHAPSRRIIYYANLPEIISRPSDSAGVGSQRRYEPLPLRPKYSRDSGRDEGLARSQQLAVDRYRYTPSGRVNSYTIIDSEPPPQPPAGNRNYPSRSAGYQELPGTKYNQIPAPYRPSDATGRGGPTQQPFYDAYPRNREPAVDPGALVRDEPYRDYNPRQPAPWSVQIGTRLTVKDDGRPYRRDDGRPFRQEDDGQRRFYVNSQLGQDKPRYNAPDEDRTRYRLL